MEAVEVERVSKLLKLDKDVVERINKAKGLKQLKTGDKIFDREFYSFLLNQGLKKFEEENS